MREWLNPFEQYLQQTKKVSSNTRESYVRDVTAYLQYLKRTEQSIEQTKHHDVQQYFDLLQQNGRAHTTLARHLASLRAFYHFLWKRQLVTSNPCDHISLPKSEKTEPDILSLAEIDRLLNVSDRDTVAGQRDQAMLELLYASGIRVTELISLNVTDVNRKLGILTCTGAKGLQRIIPLGRSALNSLEAYLGDARDKLLKTSEEQALFLNMRGQRMTRQGFWKILKKSSERCGLGSKITPNTLRHSFASHMLTSGADIRVVQELMGHAHVVTTHAYVGTDRARIQETYLKHHPRA